MPLQQYATYLFAVDWASEVYEWITIVMLDSAGNMTANNSKCEESIQPNINIEKEKVECRNYLVVHFLS